MKALKAIGRKKAFRYLYFTVFYIFYRMLPLPQLRVIFLRLLGSQIGKNTIIHNISFFNYYRTGFSGLTIGDDCFLGDETMLDLASPLVLEDQVTLSEKVLILTHLNVGYKDHPLQSEFPSTAKPVIIRRGSFIGACATVLNGVEIGPCSFVAAGSLVNRSVGPSQLVGGVPAKLLRSLEPKKLGRCENG